MTAQEFFNKYSQAFVEASETNKLFPSVIAAQAALETGYGKSIKGNNMFGIKAIGKHTPFWKGDKELVATHEVVDGSSIPVDDYFRAYASASDSIRDHSYFLSVEPRYKENGVFEASSPEEQVYALDPF